jgi:hypothetical protein
VHAAGDHQGLPRMGLHDTATRRNDGLTSVPCSAPSLSKVPRGAAVNHEGGLQARRVSAHRPCKSRRRRSRPTCTRRCTSSGRSRRKGRWMSLGHSRQDGARCPPHSTSSGPAKEGTDKGTQWGKLCTKGYSTGVHVDRYTHVHSCAILVAKCLCHVARCMRRGNACTNSSRQCAGGCPGE